MDKTYSIGLLNKILRYSQEYIFVVNTEQTIVQANDAFCNALKYEQEDILGKSITELFNSNYPDNQFPINQVTFNKNEVSNFSTQFLTRAGKSILIQGITEFDSETNAFIFIGQQKEQTSTNSEFYKALIEDGSDLVALLDVEGNYTFVGNTVTKILGYHPEDLVGTNAFDLIHPDDKTKVEALWQQLGNADQVQVPEYRFKNSQGEWRWLESVVRDHLQNEHVRGLVINSRDITDRKQAQILLEEREQRYRCLFENHLDAVFFETKEGIIKELNNVMANQLGLPKNEIVNQPIYKFLPPEAEDFARNNLSKALEGEPIRFESKIKSNAGTTVYLHSTLIPVLIAGEAIGVYCIAKDITEQKITELSLHNSEDKYRSIIENSLNSFLLTDPDTGEIIEANTRTVKMFGYSLAELNKIGRQGILDHTEPGFIEILRTREKEGAVYGEATGIRKNGERFPCEFSSVIFTNNQGERRSSILLNDISKRKEAEQKLIRQEKQFRALVENAGDVISLTNDEGGIVYVSPAFERLTGFTRADVLGKPGYIFLAPENHEGLKLFKKELINNPGITFAHTNKLMHKNGSVIPVEGTVTNLLHDENVQAIVSNYRDISARLEAEDNIKRSEANLRAIFENAIEGFVLTDETGIIKAFNAKAKESFMMQVTGQELAVGLNILEFVEPSRIQYFKEILDKVLQGAIIEYDRSFPKEDGNTIWVHFTINPVKNGAKITGICLTGTDISLRKTTEELIIANEKRYKALVENGSDAVAILTSEGIPTYFSPALKKVLGYTEEELLNRDIIHLIHPEETHFMYAKMGEVLANPGVPLPGHTGRMLHKDGSWRWIEATVTNLLHDPDISGIVDNFRDVTEKMEADLALQQSRQKLQKILDATLDVICVFDPSGKFLQVNQAAKKVWGYEPEELLGTNFLDLVHEEDIKPSQEAAARIRSGVDVHDFENRFIRKDGTVVSLQWSSRWDEAEQVMFAIARDASEKRLRDEALRLSEERYRYLFYHNPLPMWIYEMGTFRFMEVNNAAIEKYGYSYDEFLQLTGKDIRPAEDVAAFLRTTDKVVGNRYSHREIWRHVTKSGQLLEVEITSHLIQYEGTDAILVLANDVTEKRLAEKQSEFERQNKEALINSTDDLIWSVDTNFKLIAANQAFIQSLQGSTGKIVAPGDDVLLRDFFPETFLTFWQEMYSKALTGESFKKEVHTLALAGTPQEWSEINFNPIYNGSEIIGIACYGRNITATKHFQSQLLEINKKLETAQNIAGIGYWEMDLETKKIYWSDEIYRIWGVSKDVVGDNFFDKLLETIHIEDRLAFTADVEATLRGEKNHDIKHRIYLPDKSTRCVHEKGYLILNDAGKPIRLEGTVQDITERELAQEALIKSNERFEYASRATSDAIWDWDLITDNLFWGEGFSSLFGYDLTKNEFDIKSWYEHIHPEDRERVLNSIQDIIQDKTKNYWQEEYQYQRADGDYAFVVDRGLVIRKPNGDPERMIGAMQDISLLKQNEQDLLILNEQLARRAEQLALSNAELEQFAYVASHDLQEPLRMVTSFLTQLEKNYKPQLDDRAAKYIWFAVDGAVRMRKIILDLLEYSRVGREEYAQEEVNIQEVIMDVLQLNRALIEETQAQIIAVNLPVIQAAKTPLQQVFHNLVGNALKYRSPDKVPVIKISAIELPGYWQFAIADNGIGIEPQFKDKIFILFQRLHNKDEYSGTGIGLAICKKIIESFKGKIWVESEAGSGSTFYFTITK